MRKIEFVELKDIVGMEVFTERGTEDMLRYTITQTEVQHLLADAIEALDRIVQNGSYFNGTVREDETMVVDTIKEALDALQRLTSEGIRAERSMHERFTTPTPIKDVDHS